MDIPCDSFDGGSCLKHLGDSVTSDTQAEKNSAVNFLSWYVIKPKDVQEMCRKQYLGAWRYGSAVKELYCYCRGYEFNSQPKLLKF